MDGGSRGGRRGGGGGARGGAGKKQSSRSRRSGRSGGGRSGRSGGRGGRGGGRGGTEAPTSASWRRNTGGGNNAPARNTGGGNNAPVSGNAWGRNTGGGSNAPARSTGGGGNTGGGSNAPARGAGGGGNTGGGNNVPARGNAWGSIAGGSNAPARNPGGGNNAPARMGGGNNAPARGSAWGGNTGGGNNAPARGTGGGNNAPARSTGGANASARSTGGGSNAPARSTGGGSNAPARSTGGGNSAPARGNAPARNTGGGNNAPARSTGGGNNAPARSTGGGSNAPARNTGGGSNAPARSTGGVPRSGGGGGGGGRRGRKKRTKHAGGVPMPVLVAPQQEQQRQQQQPKQQQRRRQQQLKQRQQRQQQRRRRDSAGGGGGVGFDPATAPLVFNNTARYSGVRGVLAKLFKMMGCRESTPRELFDRLVEHPEMLNARLEDNGATLLHTAIHFGREDLALELIRLGADTAATNLSGAQPLHLAVQRALWEVVDELLRCGADTRALTRLRWMPLDFATPRNVLPAAQVLCAAEVSRGYGARTWTHTLSKERDDERGTFLAVQMAAQEERAHAGAAELARVHSERYALSHQKEEEERRQKEQEEEEARKEAEERNRREAEARRQLEEEEEARRAAEQERRFKAELERLRIEEEENARKDEEEERKEEERKAKRKAEAARLVKLRKEEEERLHREKERRAAELKLAEEEKFQRELEAMGNKVELLRETARRDWEDNVRPLWQCRHPDAVCVLQQLNRMQADEETWGALPPGVRVEALLMRANACLLLPLDPDRDGALRALHMVRDMREQCKSKELDKWAASLQLMAALFDEADRTLVVDWAERKKRAKALEFPHGELKPWLEQWRTKRVRSAFYASTRATVSFFEVALRAIHATVAKKEHVFQMASDVRKLLASSVSEGPVHLPVQWLVDVVFGAVMLSTQHSNLKAPLFAAMLREYEHMPIYKHSAVVQCARCVVDQVWHRTFLTEPKDEYKAVKNMVALVSAECTSWKKHLPKMLQVELNRANGVRRVSLSKLEDMCGDEWLQDAWADTHRRMLNYPYIYPHSRVESAPGLDAELWSHLLDTMAGRYRGHDPVLLCISKSGAKSGAKSGENRAECMDAIKVVEPTLPRLAVVFSAMAKDDDADADADEDAEVELIQDAVTELRDRNHPLLTFVVLVLHAWHTLRGRPGHKPRGWAGNGLHVHPAPSPLAVNYTAAKDLEVPKSFFHLRAFMEALDNDEWSYDMLRVIFLLMLGYDVPVGLALVAMLQLEGTRALCVVADVTMPRNEVENGGYAKSRAEIELKGFASSRNWYINDMVGASEAVKGKFARVMSALEIDEEEVREHTGLRLQERSTVEKALRWAWLEQKKTDERLDKCMRSVLEHARLTKRGLRLESTMVNSIVAILWKVFVTASQEQRKRCRDFGKLVLCVDKAQMTLAQYVKLRTCLHMAPHFGFEVVAVKLPSESEMLELATCDDRELVAEVLVQVTMERSQSDAKALVMDLMKRLGCVVGEWLPYLTAVCGWKITKKK